jgi:hypothetical protein
MPNTIDNLVIENDGVFYKHRYICLSDGTAMTDVVAVQLSSLTSKGTGVAPKALDLVEFEGATWGTVASILLEWDHTTDDEILVMNNNTNVYWTKERGQLKDPRTTGGTGDVVITSNSLAANAGFMFYAVWKLRDDRT